MKEVDFDGGSSAEVDYHRIIATAATNSTKKIGSNIGGTSHSRILNLLMFDILAAFGLGGSAKLSVTDISLRRAVILKTW
jgi:hypothetical protein